MKNQGRPGPQMSSIGIGYLMFLALILLLTFVVKGIAAITAQPLSLWICLLIAGNVAAQLFWLALAVSLRSRKP